ncbi:sulfotransferase family protein [Porticoccus sp.]
MVDEFAKKEFLIIAGAPRCGTTSLFNYLSSHPEINAATTKEVRFFLDEGYPLPSACRFEMGLSEYARYFPGWKACDDKVLMEASPDYLFSQTALRIRERLPNARLVFILRDPKERLASYYRYAMQRGFLEQTATFKDYVERQLMSEVRTDTPLHLRALEQGRYEHYLRPFREQMGDQLLVIDFERLRQKPEEVMMDVASFTGIDSHYYENYPFTVENDSHNLRFMKIDQTYRYVRRRLQRVIPQGSRLRIVAKWMNRKVIKKALKHNRASMADVLISSELNKRLNDYYGL